MSIDGFVLRCNIIRCRALLDQRAIVTTCSHIFCPDCADNVGLVLHNNGHTHNHNHNHHGHENTNNNNPGTGIFSQRFCPACRTPLPTSDDAVLTMLNPGDEYKTSVLSGLAPATIMEVAMRGLAFWSYQASQEIVYQDTVSRNLNDKYAGLSAQMDKLILDANTEITGTRARLESVALERDAMERKLLELGEAYREKSKKCLQIQDLYDKLKRRMFMSDVQSAATETVENMTMHMGGNMQQDHGFDDMGQGQRGGGLGGLRSQSRHEMRFGGMDNPISIEDLHGNSSAGLGGLRLNAGAGGGGRQTMRNNMNSGGVGSVLRSSLGGGGDGGENMAGIRGAGGGGGRPIRGAGSGVLMDLDPQMQPCQTPIRGAGGIRQSLAPTPGGVGGVGSRQNQQQQHFGNLQQQQQHQQNDNFFSQNNPNSTLPRQGMGGMGGIGGMKYSGGLMAGMRMGRQQSTVGGGGIGGGQGDGGMGIRGGKGF